ncbi:hypothetical protein IWZ03DRAFT_378039 [Phyllosticta citriasiana]|uniref:Secreted protein n=1 Tax=Phyllosticta citriasiana TaxID=595635 RepID=A0ABR1KK15_9PEZI
MVMVMVVWRFRLLLLLRMVLRLLWLGLVRPGRMMMVVRAFLAALIRAILAVGSARELLGEGRFGLVRGSGEMFRIPS